MKKEMKWTENWCPATKGGMQNESSVGLCTRCMHAFARLVPICKLSRCLLTKISASELRRKFIKSVLLVGHFFSKVFLWQCFILEKPGDAFCCLGSKKKGGGGEIETN